MKFCPVVVLCLNRAGKLDLIYIIHSEALGLGKKFLACVDWRCFPFSLDAPRLLSIGVGGKSGVKNERALQIVGQVPTNETRVVYLLLKATKNGIPNETRAWSSIHENEATRYLSTSQNKTKQDTALSYSSQDQWSRSYSPDLLSPLSESFVDRC